MGSSTARHHCPHEAPAEGGAPATERRTHGLPSIDELARSVSFGAGEDGDARTGILLVSHGSRSQEWRRMLLDVHAEVASELLAIPGVGQVRTAFMEYTEPSIASQLRAFDESDIESVIVVPLLLTISDHSFDDIPTICGLSSDPERVAQLTKEKIEIYRPRADLGFAPLLDFSGLVQTNLARRVRALVGGDGGRQGQRDGLVLVGYGSAEFDREWNRFFREMEAFAQSELGIEAATHAWCGHIVRYKRQPVIDAIGEICERADRVIVIPILVAYDPMFQERIIGRAVARSPLSDRVLYQPDAILPEPEVGRWVVDITRRMARDVVGERETSQG